MRTLTRMDSKDLNLKQLDTLFARLGPMSCYVGKIVERAHHHGWPQDDELYRLAREAAAAMERLALHVHYEAVEKIRTRKG